MKKFQWTVCLMTQQYPDWDFTLSGLSASVCSEILTDGTVNCISVFHFIPTKKSCISTKYCQDNANLCFRIIIRQWIFTKNVNQLKWSREQFLCVTELRRPSFSCRISPAGSDFGCFANQFWPSCLMFRSTGSWYLQFQRTALHSNPIWRVGKRGQEVCS